MSKITVFTDGSCSNNGYENSYGGIGIHFPGEELNDISKVYPKSTCTNQKTELYAILVCLRYIKLKLGMSKYKVIIKTDSMYSINCITKWCKSWIKNDWLTANRTPVANKELIESIYNYYLKYDIEFKHVEAHTGKQDKDSLGNEIADRLATDATTKARGARKPEQLIRGKKMNSDNQYVVKLLEKRTENKAK